MDAVVEAVFERTAVILSRKVLVALGDPEVVETDRILDSVSPGLAKAVTHRLTKLIEAEGERMMAKAFGVAAPSPDDYTLTFGKVDEAMRKARYGDAYVPPMFGTRSPFCDLTACA